MGNVPQVNYSNQGMKIHFFSDQRFSFTTNTDLNYLSSCELSDLYFKFVLNRIQIDFNQRFLIRILKPNLLIATNQIEFILGFRIQIRIISKYGRKQPDFDLLVVIFNIIRRF